MTENNPETTDGPEYAMSCTECKTGVQHLRYITYFTWLEDELITVPNFPAWVCDLCGRREYDARAINWLNTMLNPGTGRKAAPKRRGGTFNIDRPST